MAHFARFAHRSLLHRFERRLFHTVALTPTSRGIENWNNILRTDLRHNVRRVVINSTPIPTYTGSIYASPKIESDRISHWVDGDYDADYDEFNTSLSKISKLPQVDHACLRFTENCAAGVDDFHSEHENAEHRRNMLEQFFQALRDRQQDPSTCPVKTLTIYNLQNMPLPDFTSSPLFRSVMQNVEHLQLQICEELHEHGPDTDIYCEERRTFMPYLQEHWLAPVASQLKSLTVYFPDCWGPLPGYFSGDGLFFSQLENLTLGRYCLAHDDAFDWVLKHKTLKCVRLHNCMIASHIHLSSHEMSNWQVKMHDWKKLPTGAFGFDGNYGDCIYNFSGTWKDVFNNISNELLRLTDFSFDFDQIHVVDQFLFDRPDRLKTRLGPNRYVVFEEGTLPTPWIDADDKTGAMNFGDNDERTYERVWNVRSDAELNRHEETQKEDGEALNALQNKLFLNRRSQL